MSNDPGAIEQRSGIVHYRGGTHSGTDWFKPVWHPWLGTGLGWGQQRTGNNLRFNTPGWGDSGPDHTGFGDVWNQKSMTQFTEAYVDGVRVDRKTSSAAYANNVKPTEQDFRVVTDTTLDPDVWRLATKGHSEWTFKSAATPADHWTFLPMLNLGFDVDTDLHGDVPAGKRLDLGIFSEYVKGAPDTGRITGSTLEVSFDDGATWTSVELDGVHGKSAVWAGSVRVPDDAQYISVRASAADDRGGSVKQEILRAVGVRIGRPGGSCADGGAAPAPCRMRRGSSGRRGVALAYLDSPTGEPSGGDGQPQVAASVRPRVRVRHLVQLLHFLRVGHGRRCSDGQNTPPLTQRVVDVVDLEGDHVTRRGGRRGPGCRPEGQETADDHVVDRDNYRPLRRGDCDPPHPVRGQQCAALISAQLDQLRVITRTAGTRRKIHAAAGELGNGGIQSVGQPQHEAHAGHGLLFLEVLNVGGGRTGPLGHLLPAESQLFATCRNAPAQVTRRRRALPAQGLLGFFLRHAAHIPLLVGAITVPRFRAVRPQLQSCAGTTQTAWAGRPGPHPAQPIPWSAGRAR